MGIVTGSKLIQQFRAFRQVRFGIGEFTPQIGIRSVCLVENNIVRIIFGVDIRKMGEWYISLYIRVHEDYNEYYDSENIYTQTYDLILDF